MITTSCSNFFSSSPSSCIKHLFLLQDLPVPLHHLLPSPPAQSYSDKFWIWTNIVAWDILLVLVSPPLKSFLKDRIIKSQSLIKKWKSMLSDLYPARKCCFKMHFRSLPTFIDFDANFSIIFSWAFLIKSMPTIIDFVPTYIWANFHWFPDIFN